MKFLKSTIKTSRPTSTKRRKPKSKRVKKREVFESLSCHPIVKPKVVGENDNNNNKAPMTTCYNNETLMALKNAWNEQNPYQRINSDNTTTIWKQLQHFFRDKCSRESCWLKELDAWIKGVNGREVIKTRFAPQSPKSWNRDPHEWLSNFDIEAVMRQFEQKYPFFKFIGSSPIDFDASIYEDSKTKARKKKEEDNDDNDDDDQQQQQQEQQQHQQQQQHHQQQRRNDCVENKLCNFNLESYIKKGITKIGFSFNTDPHDEPGEHWITLFVDIKRKFIFYFDSAGDEIPKEIEVLKNRIVQQGKALNPRMHFKFDQNHPVDHQLRDSECGIYSLFFMQSMIEETMDPVKFKRERNVIRDGEMHKLRKKYFNFKL